MSKEIDINNEEEILKECDFDYFYESENCSHEICMFYNDIRKIKATQPENFNKRQALIDLGRIAITLNQQAQRIAELEEQLKNAIVLPCIKKHTTYLDIDSGFVEVAWYVIFKQNGYGDEIFTIKCGSEEDAIKELKALKGENK